jgi:glucose/arabinose dehydrogenase
MLRRREMRPMHVGAVFLVCVLALAACGEGTSQVGVGLEVGAQATPAVTPSPVAAATPAGEQPGAEGSAGLTPTTATTAPQPVTGTGAVTSTSAVTGTDAVTGTGGVTTSEAVIGETPAALAPLPPNTMIGVELVAEGLAAPMYLAAQDAGPRLFVVDQAGLIRVIADGQLVEQPFLDLRDRMVTLNPGYDERGLLGLAFHPDFAENGRFFVYYSAPLREGAPAGFDHTSHLAEFHAGGDANLADPASEMILLQIDEPQSNHNGGGLAFGPDGYLYVALGDGGGANDVDPGHVDDWYDANAGGNGQDIAANLLGSILRLDVNSGDPYGVPADNPFVGQANALPEIYAYGFRNPYSFSFDRQTGELYAADAGQDLWEEVDRVVKGGNYGWNVKEGAHCFNAANPSSPLDGCPDATPDGVPLIDPVIEYPHINNPSAAGLGLVSVGGFVYRGSQIPALTGRYIFADWSTSWDQPDGTLLVATPAAEGPWSFQELAVQGQENGRLGQFVRGFGEDGEGELYVLVSGMAGPAGDTGKVYKLVPAQAP